MGPKLRQIVASVVGPVQPSGTLLQKTHNVCFCQLLADGAASQHESSGLILFPCRASNNGGAHDFLKSYKNSTYKSYGLRIYAKVTQFLR